MASIEEVERFLADFKVKLSIWGLWARDDRGKNSQTLRQFDITAVQRKQILLELSSSQYCMGPIPDTLNKGPDLWMFGARVKSKEVYIKITIGYEQAPVHCISFHIADHSLHYPFK